MDISESHKVTEHQNQVNNFCQNIISNNQVQSVHVQQEGEYLNINIKIKIDPTKIHHNIHNSDNTGINLNQETPATSTQIVDNTFSNTGHQNIDSITYERFLEQLVSKKHNEIRQISPNQGTTTNPSKVDPVKKLIRPQSQQNGMKYNLKFHGKGHSRMLVILDNGEQRLITFVSPNGLCSVQELLDQVGIEIGAESNIECIENPGSEIDYIVKVGNFGTRDTIEMIKAAENHIRQQAAQQKMTASQQKTVQQPVNETPKSPEPSTKLPPPKYVEGFYAVCSACGFSGSDHAKCERCHRIFSEDVKNVRMPENYRY